MILWLLSVLLVLLVLFFRVSDSTLNLWLAHKFGVDEGAYFRGKTVWVVGCSSGIGESIVERLAPYGCKIILSARRKPLLQQLMTECKESHPQSEYRVVPLDVTEFHTLADKVAEAKGTFGPIDVIILNSGQSQRSEWSTVCPQVDEACFRVNALGPTVIAREYIKTLETDENGNFPPTQFVVVSSVGGIIPAILSPSYSAAKHALMGYFRLLSLEYSSRRLAVSIICPSLTFAPNNPLTAFADTIDQNHGEVLTEASPRHMSSDRCANHILTAAANNISECWLSQTANILLFVYGTIYFPEITKRIINFIGIENLKRMRTGKK